MNNEKTSTPTPRTIEILNTFGHTHDHLKLFEDICQLERENTDLRQTLEQERTAREKAELRIVTISNQRNDSFEKERERTESAEQQFAAERNETIRLNGLLRVAHTERNDTQKQLAAEEQRSRRRNAECELWVKDYKVLEQRAAQIEKETIERCEKVAAPFSKPAYRAIRALTPAPESADVQDQETDSEGWSKDPNHWANKEPAPSADPEQRRIADLRECWTICDDRRKAWKVCASTDDARQARYETRQEEAGECADAIESRWPEIKEGI